MMTENPKTKAAYEENFKNFLCAVAWLHQYCADTYCEDCVVFKRSAFITSVDPNFECPLTSDISPNHWDIDGKSEIFTEFTDNVLMMDLAKSVVPDDNF